MATLTVQKPSTSGQALTYAAAGAGGDQFTNSGREFIHVKNADASPVTVTVTSGNASANKCSFGIAHTAHDLTVSVPAGSDRMIGPLNTARFNDANNVCRVTYSGVTSVTVAVISNNV